MADSEDLIGAKRPVLSLNLLKKVEFSPKSMASNNSFFNIFSCVVQITFHLLSNNSITMFLRTLVNNKIISKEIVIFRNIHIYKFVNYVKTVFIIIN